MYSNFITSILDPYVLPDYYLVTQKFSALLEIFPLNFIESITTAFVGYFKYSLNTHCVD